MIFTNIFKSVDKICLDMENHYTYTISINNFLISLSNIKNWKYNEPPNDIKYISIAESINKLGFLNNNCIYCVYNKKDSNLYIYDGNQRYQALLFINKTNQVDFDKIRNKELILKVYESNDITKDKSYIETLFLDINKSVGKKLLIINNDDNKELIVDELTKHYKNRFNSYLKTPEKRGTPNRPHFNEKLLNDLFNKLCDKYPMKDKDGLLYSLEKCNNTLKSQMNDLNQLNHSYNLKGQAKISQKMINNCEKKIGNKLYLFLLQPEILINNI
jgi:hypothetical protein